MRTLVRTSSLRASHSTTIRRTPLPSLSGPQSSLRALDHSQPATETTAQMVLTALERSAPEPTAQWTAHPEPHAPRRSQTLSHTTTLTQTPEDHTRPPVILPRLPQRQLPPTPGQLPRLSSNWLSHQSTMRPRKFPFSKPHGATPTPPTTE